MRNDAGCEFLARTFHTRRSKDGLRAVGTARCAVPAPSGAEQSVRKAARTTHRHQIQFRPLNAGGDSAARCPYLNLSVKYSD